MIIVLDFFMTVVSLILGLRNKVSLIDVMLIHVYVALVVIEHHLLGLNILVVNVVSRVEGMAVMGTGVMAIINVCDKVVHYGVNFLKENHVLIELLGIV